MNNQQEREIVEDAPQYRSVMMARPMGAPPLPRSLQRPVLKSAPVTSLDATITKAAKGKWGISNLASIPAEYFLERTHVYVDGSAQDVADRLSSSLMHQSVALKFDEEDKNIVRAETNDCCTFAIRLFADKGMVVVEIQRTSGCSYQFRELARSLLRSAKGTKAPGPKRTFTIPSSIPKTTVQDAEKRTTDGLNIAKNMLSSPKLDSRLLGLESLEKITQSCECRTLAATTVLGDDCRAQLVDFVQNEESNGSSEIEDRTNMLSKRKALCILANAFSALADAGELKTCLDKAAELTSNDFVAVLIDAIKEAANHPHEATHAAGCLKHLSTVSGVKEMLLQPESLEAVSAAYEVGKQANAALQEQSNQLKKELL